MKLILIGIGKIRTGYIRTGIEEYLSRIKRYTSIELLVVKEERLKAERVQSILLEREAKSVLAKIGKGDFVILLSEKGYLYTSEAFARLLEGLLAHERKRICFVMGGPYGVHDSLLKRANINLSLSPMTLPHEMARLVLCEQIYRGFTILQGAPYSH